MADGITREFFDRTETDDTLQNIRKQYLASKKNLHELMAKKTTNDDAGKASPVRLETLDIHPPKLVPLQQQRSPIHTSSSADNIILLNELRSLKAAMNEQQNQIDRLKYDLQKTKSLNFQLEDKVCQLQNHLAFIENDVINQVRVQPRTAPSSSNMRTESYRDVTPYRHIPVEDNTTRLIQITGPK